MSFQEDDLVVVAEGDFKGHYGTVLKYEPVFQRYYVQLPELSTEGYFAFQEHELVKADEETTDDDEEEYEETPRFGMADHEFVQHVEFLMERALSRAVQVGPESAFFGFQEFEGKTPEEVLFMLLEKLEDGIAHLAQTHILVSRIGVALRATMKEVTHDDN